MPKNSTADSKSQQSHERTCGMVSTLGKKTNSMKPMATEEPFVVILSRNPDHPIYTSWRPQLPLPIRHVTDFGPDWSAPVRTATLVTHDAYRGVTYRILTNSMDQGIPTLILADGILEYRNCWQRERTSQAGIFNPVLGHKLACIGNSQARFVESWGNRGKCEVVGLPRLDGERPPAPVAISPRRILVCSAQTPWFGDEDRASILQSFLDLRKVARRMESEGKCQFLWRLTGDLPAALGIQCDTQTPLAEDLATCHAVITSPSTVLLESMLAGRPTALLDYTGSPTYVPAAWQIHHSSKLQDILHQLLVPSRPHMLYQEATLHDSLQLEETASARMVRLVQEMARYGQATDRRGVPLKLPANILPPPGTTND